MTKRPSPVPIARVGVISDTHGLLRDQALQALEGVERIIHAGDIGEPRILHRLAALAPVTAVLGNVDHADWAGKLPLSAEVEIHGRWLHVLHILDDIDLDPAAAGFAAVIHGHSHRPSVEERNGVLYINPGSAGPRRFRLPVTVAVIEVTPDGIAARTVSLDP